MATEDNSPLMAASPISIVGCPRSGTALLRNLLRSHPNLTFPDESHFIPAFYTAYGDPRSDGEARRLGAKILGLFWVRNWGMDLAPEAFAGCRTFRDVLCRLYGEWARRENKPRWGDKTPQYVTAIPLLRKIFPEAKIIHIYRDGRDVALSWLRHQMEPRNLYRAASLWKERVETGREAGRKLSADTYAEVCYERLLENTRAVMRRVCDFIEEPFREAVLTPTPLPVRPRVTLHKQQPIRGWTTVMLTNAAKWRTEMTDADRILFESVAGDLLEALGYEAAGPRRRVLLPERLFWRAHHAALYTWTRLRSPYLRERLASFLRMRAAGWR